VNGLDLLHMLGLLCRRQVLANSVHLVNHCCCPLLPIMLFALNSLLVSMLRIFLLLYICSLL
jgi:hypothetical protein